MYNSIEIEAKVLLNKEQYDKLYKFLKMDDTMSFTQANYYIDSEDWDLKNNDIALRIRYVQTQKRYVLTLKTPMSEGLLEKNQELKTSDAKKMIDENIFPEGEVKDFLELLEVDTSKLKIVAHMDTLRTEIRSEEKDEVISLDQNTYGDRIDYELEVDKSGMALAQARITELLTQLGIHVTFNTKSKQSRAIAACCK